MKKRTTWVLGIAALLLIAGFVAAVSEGFVPTTLWQAVLAVLVIGPLLIFAEVIFEILFGAISFVTGWLLLPVLTFGKMRMESEEESLSYRWYGIARGDDGRYVASWEATGILGMLFLLLLLIGGTAAYQTYFQTLA